ncbi:asparagine synthase-related protein [Kribbella sp. NPDC051587]|uniref:asparagine synthase-related protein n=1 Tax=Kribbella sp. NPDC051587 TaxID=3364119 RepID=UPI0037BA22AF
MALPDVDAAEVSAARVRSEADHEIFYPSGRPFVLACADEVAIDPRDGLRVVLGEGAAIRSGPGSVHVLEAVDGGVWVRGTASGLRRVFHARLNGVRIASDRADVLAGLVDAAPDPVGIALRLLSPGAPWPLAWHSMWSGVTAVPPGHSVDLMSGRCERWWSPPEPELSLAAAATALREALEQGVQIRQRGKAKVACDLSGLDSSSLFGLAVQGGPVVGLTYQADDPMDEDVAAARWLAEHFGAEHDVLAAEAAPLPFDGVHGDLFDEPTWVSAYRARIGTASARAAAYGAELRFAGHGGDELLMPPPVWLTDIARRQPLRAARLARRVQAKYRLPAGAIAALLTDRTTYAEWFATSLARRQSAEMHVLGWGVPPNLPSWLTSDAVALVRDAVAGCEVEPLASTRGMHATLEFVHNGALAARHVAQLGEVDGVPVASPFFDDRVLEAALAVRPEEAIDPRRYKPQLVSAMAGVLPERALLRTSKSDISMTVSKGWSRHRSTLLGLLDDSELGRLGLVDVDAVRRICRGPYDVERCGPVRQLLEVESWLKGLR